MTNPEAAIGLTAKMYDTRRFLKEHSSSETYDKLTSAYREMIQETMSYEGITNEPDAALEICKIARDAGATDQIGWVITAAMDMIKGDDDEQRPPQ